MAGIFDPTTALLCDESTKDLCFDDLGDDDDDEYTLENDDQSSRSEPPLIHLPEQSEEGILSLLEREREYLPKDDYLKRLRSGDLDLNARREAFDWIFKAHAYYSFGPLSFCLAVNYLDRFFSIRELPRDKAWTVQLLAVACLSIAAKIEETCVPQSIEFQVGDPKYVFEAKTIQRMELVVLDTLKWKMNAVTPCSFLDYSLKKLSDAHNVTKKLIFSATVVVNRSMQLIMCTIRGIDFLEFRPSEIAAAVALCVSAEIQAVDIDKAISCFIHLEEGRVLKCLEMIKDMSQMIRSGNVGSGSLQRVPQSPIGVLDAGCFSYKSDELTNVVASCANSSIITTRSPETKRIKLGSSSTSGLDS